MKVSQPMQVFGTPVLLSTLTIGQAFYDPNNLNNPSIVVDIVDAGISITVPAGQVAIVRLNSGLMNLYGGNTPVVPHDFIAE